MRRTGTALLLGLALIVATEAQAQACSCGRDLIGAGRLYLGAGGVLPPDASGFPWTGPESIRDAADRVKVARIEGERRVPVRFTIVDHSGVDIIIPAQKFAPGQVYEVTVRESARASESRKYYDSEDSLPPAEVKTRVTIAAAPLRLTHASVRAGPQTRGVVKLAVPASCSEQAGAARVPIRVELSPEVEPLRDYLLYMTLLDGHTWDPRESLCSSIDPGRTWTGEVGTDMVFARCDGGEAGRRTSPFEGRWADPMPGRHSVEVRVYTADGSQTITTPAIPVELSCAPPGAPPAPREPPAGPLEASEPAAAPTLERGGCAIGEPGFAWVLGAGWLVRRRRSAA